MLHKTATERYDKLRCVFNRLKENFNRNDLDDFIQTANSLREWIREDNTLTDHQRAALEKFVISESVDWQICNQLANQQKHVGKSNPRTKKAVATSVKVTAVEIMPNGAGVMVPTSMRVIGAGEKLTIEWNGQKESALGFVIRTFSHFHYIFEGTSIPPENVMVEILR